ncbi:hypothetical protein GGX14DRAFT_570000 [Mycena pura]|uniref:F-box domain-containing protein n=1 Tax=Mycena pura TaxID=153505 RepID=A0AAD6V9L9_9AGAR|nr:hypothetical protein GGX14DRAFT_570000 [Mycena pura]
MRRVTSAAIVLLGRLLRLLRVGKLVHFFRSSRAPSPRTSTSLTDLPSDVLYLIFALLSDRSRDRTWYGGFCDGFYLIPVSETCRYMRQQAKPWIFREVYNWNREEGDVWPKSLWPFIVQVHLRDCSIYSTVPITLSSDLFKTLPLLLSLSRVILDLRIAIPPDKLVALSLLPQLRSLELRQARLDGPSLSLPQASFASLERLVISIWRISQVLRIRDVDQQRECVNVAVLLRAASGSLTTLSISGDLVSRDFLSIKWPCLRNLTITEHTPAPYLSVPDIISQMTAVRRLSVLYTADKSRDVGERRPPFTLGVRGGDIVNASPYLREVTLSNLQPDDPIFQQLPSRLEALHIVAAEDLYLPVATASRNKKWAPLAAATALTVLKNIFRLTDITELTLTLDHFATPALVHRIATALPSLQVLELGHAEYPQGSLERRDVRDHALLEPLTRLTSLRRLRISLDFYERIGRYHDRQRAAQIRAARWFLIHLPALQDIAFSCDNWFSWRSYYPLERVSWATYSRAVLFLEAVPTPPPTPSGSRVDFRSRAPSPVETRSTILS